MRWVAVEGWPYEVSDQGDVRRAGKRRSGATIGRILTPWWGGEEGKERLYVTLTDRGERVDPFVHKLVALAFLGPPPFDGAQIDHINGDRTDNRAANLEWVTREENTARRYGRGLEESTDDDAYAFDAPLPF